jgi:hypothetical protein
MINSISSAQTSYASQVSQPVPKAQPQQQDNALPQDTVSLKSTNDVDHDGDNH